MLYLSELDFFLMFTVLKVSLNKGQIFSWSLKLSCNNDSVIIIARREPGEDYAIAPVCECVHNQQACILSPADLKYYQTDQPNFFVHIHDCMLKDLCDSQFFLKNLEKQLAMR